jgi:hypothetical protein
MPSEMFDFHINNDEYLKNLPISLFNDYIGTREQLLENHYNFLILNEPKDITGLHEWVLNNNHMYNCIFTWDSTLLKKCSNAILFPYGMTSRFCRPWDETCILPEYRQPTPTYKKIFEISFLCGEKKMLPGHSLRHSIFSNKDKINIPNHIIYSTNDRVPWENGKDRCWDSMFHIAVENTYHENYFTEKIIDVFLTNTIPLYWGCPNIENYFNKEGIIIFDNEKELIDIINNLTPEFYISKQDVIKENFNNALKYADYMSRIKNLLIEICQFNNL